MNKISKTTEKIILSVILFILLLIPSVTLIIKKGSESNVQQKETEEEQKAEDDNEKDLLDTTVVIYNDTITDSVFTKIYSVHKDGSIALAKHYGNFDTSFVFNVDHKAIATSKNLFVWKCVVFYEATNEDYLSSNGYYANSGTLNPISCLKARREENE